MSISLTKYQFYLGSLVLLLAFGSCKREVVEQYELNDVTLYSSASEKKNLKTDEQFISILYTDLFGKSISNSELKKLNRSYSSLGDKSLIIDVMIQSLLINSESNVATPAEMRARPDEFITETYKRFLVRQPTEQERWFLKNKITENPALDPIDIYYAMLTSEEYRYY